MIIKYKIKQSITLFLFFCKLAFVLYIFIFTNGIFFHFLLALVVMRLIDVKTLNIKEMYFSKKYL